MRGVGTNQKVLHRKKGEPEFTDATSWVNAYQAVGKVTHLITSYGKQITCLNENLKFVTHKSNRALAGDECLLLDGEVWDAATGVQEYGDGSESWYAIYLSNAQEEPPIWRQNNRVRVIKREELRNQRQAPIGYLLGVATRSSANDGVTIEGAPTGLGHLRSEVMKLIGQSSETVFTTVITGRKPAVNLPEGSVNKETRKLLFPFNSNLSQQQAIERGLNHEISFIEGPPGTGKTETILNLIANLVNIPNTSVAVVSQNNSAIDNVYEGLGRKGIDFLAARLGNNERKEEFYANQERRNRKLTAYLAGIDTNDNDDATTFERISENIQEVYQTRVELSKLVAEKLKCESELGKHRQRMELVTKNADTGVLIPEKVHQLSAEQILQIVAEVDVFTTYKQVKLLQRTWWKLRNRYVRGFDAGLHKLSSHDQAVLTVRLQEVFYVKRISEIETRTSHLEENLRTPELSYAAENIAEFSVQLLNRSILERYASLKRKIYQPGDWNKKDSTFLKDYPVIISTCQSISSSLPRGQLVDYLIIDESSMVNVLEGMIALSYARNVVVVGDSKQLPHIPPANCADLQSSEEYLDVNKHSILSSLKARFEATGFDNSVPTTLLREHYRCDPRIIEFCNRKFYDGQLLVMTKPSSKTPMRLVQTASGHHCRNFGGSYENQREIDVITHDILPELQGVFASKDVAVISPYRNQANLVSVQIPEVKADTVHKFQGRSQEAVVLSTILDEAVESERAVAFVDDPNLLNVAVSRAKQLLVVVANPNLPPACVNLRELVTYLETSSDAEVAHSRVLSVFDVLGKNYDAELVQVRAKLVSRRNYVSEEIIENLLNETLTSPQFLAANLRVHYQVRLMNLLGPRCRSLLSDEEYQYVRNGSSLDFVIFNRVTNQALGVIEVDGVTFHKGNARQTQRDKLKNSILNKYGTKLLRLETTSSGEAERLKGFLLGLG